MTVLFVLLMLIVFLTADHLVQRARARAAVPALADGTRRLPAGVALAPNHTWLRHEPGGVATVGLDELIGSVVGSIDRIVFPEVGASFAYAQSPISLSHGGKTLEVSAPVTGRVVAVNRDLANNPSLLSTDPYGQGWVVRVQLDHHEDRKTLSGTEAAHWLRKQMEQVKEFLMNSTPQAALVMQDGGALSNGVLKNFDQEVWDEFARRFATLYPDAK